MNEQLGKMKAAIESQAGRACAHPAGVCGDVGDGRASICGVAGEKGNEMKKLVMLVVFVAAMAARADYWMTFCKTPGGQQYSQVGNVNPDADGIVTITAGPLTVVVYKTQVWYQNMPGEVPGQRLRTINNYTPSHLR